MGVRLGFLFVAALTSGPLAGQASRPTRAETPPGPTVTIVDAATWRPVPGARLELVLHEDVIRRVGRWPGGEPWDKAEREVARSFTASGRGTVVLPRLDGTASLIGHAAGLWGREEYDHSGVDQPGPMVLPLHPDSHLRVQTVDASGRNTPDVPVALWGHTGISSLRLWSGITRGPEAIARLEHFGWWSARCRTRILSSNGTGHAMALSVDVAGASDSAVSIDPSATSGTLTRLVVPPTGRLEIVLSGVPEPDAAMANAYVRRQWTEDDPRAENEAAENASPRWLWSDRPSIGLALGKTPHVLSHVRTGSRLSVVAISLAGAFPMLRIEEIAGPAKAEETVRVELTPTREVIEIRGRLAEPQRARVDGLPLWMEVMAGSDLVASQTLLGNPQGALSLRIPTLEIEGHDAVKLTTRLYRGRQCWIGEAIARRPESSEGWSFGELRLREGSLIVAGTVVDPAGIPVCGARVWAGRESTTSDIEGRFRIHGEFEGRESYVASKAGWITTRGMLGTDPTADLKIVLRAGESLHGRLLIPPGGNIGHLGIQVRRADGTLLPDSARPADDGTFLLEHLPADAGRIELMIPHHPPISMGAARSPRKETDRRRIREFDLTDVIRWQILRLVDENGLPASFIEVFSSDAHVMREPGGVQSMRMPISDREGLIGLWSGPEPMEVTLWHEAHRAVPVLLDGTSRTVVLSRQRYEIEVHFPEDLPKPPPEYKLCTYATLLSKPPAPRPIDRQPWRSKRWKLLHDSGIVRLKKAEPGLYVVRLGLQYIDGMFVRVHDTGCDLPVEIKPDVTRNVIEFPVDREMLLEAFRKLKKR